MKTKTAEITALLAILLTLMLAMCLNIFAGSSDLYDPVSPSDAIQGYLSDNFNHLIGYGHFSDGKTYSRTDLKISDVKIRFYGASVSPDEEQNVAFDIVSSSRESGESWLYFVETKDADDPVMLIQLTQSYISGEVGHSVGGKTVPIYDAYGIMKSLIGKAGLVGEPIIVSSFITDRVLVFSFNGDERIIIADTFNGLDESYKRVSDYTQLPTLKQYIDKVNEAIIHNREVYGNTPTYGGIDLSDIKPDIVESEEMPLPLIIGCSAGVAVVVAGAVAAVIAKKKSGKKEDI